MSSRPSVHAPLRASTHDNARTSAFVAVGCNAGFTRLGPLQAQSPDESFGHYLAGLTDGEGCFVVQPKKGRNSYRCDFVIHLRADDLPLLEWLRETTGLGEIYPVRRVTIGNAHPTFAWRIVRQQDCVALVALFERFPLRSKKARDFRLWAQAVRAWQASRWDLMRDCRLAIQATRAFSSEDAEFVVDDPQLELAVGAAGNEAA